ncbi:hypothetical protein OB919_07010 [Halobacteria archaeon AArc-curdl1]|uniref:Uncharacterized protein n=1 Tax=Natronosalvus hydrolyticus TaxID=2979988 RepID=A0AAP2Z724_9EURY|nr:hypothetical protein [Halobacteria archaeon AArc-curdl1]
MGDTGQPSAGAQTAESAAGDGSDPATRLEHARDRLERAERALEEAGGRDRVETGADAYRNAMKLLETYVDRASGSGRETFKAYVELEGKFSTLIESLPEELPHREAFDASLEAIDKRRLTESDFERAEQALEPASEAADLLEEYEAAREEQKAALTAARTRLETVEAEIEDRKRLLELGDADLEAPVERLQEPIETYNEALREAAFETYRSEASARTVFTLLERSRHHPFVPFEQPPEELREYVETTDAGEYSISKLLEYAQYSRSKLSHYVDDAGELKRRIATRQTYLERLDSTPLELEWPPAEAGVLRHAIRDKRPLVERVGGQELVDRLLAVRRLTFDNDVDFDRLQRAATAIEQLSTDERERLADGRIEIELEELREERKHLETVLSADS